MFSHNTIEFITKKQEIVIPYRKCDIYLNL